MDTNISNVSEKLIVGKVDTSFATLSSKFKPGTAVLNGPVYMGDLTGSIGLDRATCTIGPALTGLPASLEVDGVTNIYGNLNVFGIKNVFALSNIFGFTSKIGAEIQAAFKLITGGHVSEAVSITQGPKICQATATAPLVKADEGIFGGILVGGDIKVTGSITAPIIEIIETELIWLNTHKKTFDIPHPTKEGWRLRHVCIEGPTADVYVRGKLKDSNIIELPEYWRKLVDPETITVTLTPIGAYQELYVDEIEWGTRIIVKTNSGSSINCYYTVYGERADTDKNIPEYEGTYDDYPGDNGQYTPYGTAIVQ